MTVAPSGGAVTRVAVAHPAGLLLGEARGERAGRPLNDVLPNSPAGTLDLAAEVLRHQLHAVADAEHGDAELVEAGVDLRRVLGVDRGRPAGEDHGGAGSSRAGPRADDLWPTSSE